MPRPKRNRIIISPPACGGFKPVGTSVTERNGINMTLEEYESIRLCDYEMMNHHEASELMQVSRATFARIYESARRKVALAFTEALPLNFSGGDFTINQKWWECTTCGSLFTENAMFAENHCALCSSDTIKLTNQIFTTSATEVNCHVCGRIGERKQHHGIKYTCPLCDQHKISSNHKRP